MLVAIHTHTILGTDKTTKIQHTTHTHTPHTLHIPRTTNTTQPQRFRRKTAQERTSCRA
jgi:hypothetical protein